MHHPGRGRLYVRCGTKGRTATWYRPRHGYGLRPPGAGPPGRYRVTFVTQVTAGPGDERVVKWRSPAGYTVEVLRLSMTCRPRWGRAGDGLVVNDQQEGMPIRASGLGRCRPAVAVIAWPVVARYLLTDPPAVVICWKVAGAWTCVHCPAWFFAVTATMLSTNFPEPWTPAYFPVP